ncbi:alpha/beta fold hydrolase [Stigmatella sp. ncwal1]|uniref:Alpha/beta fold hydrolase n=1 Tax=Stigmatella ashevillensis TaxID=2995309 RepID=A0ABT5DGD6_9BACT|nr:alpha/beta fold hydrolase [Stigmatella ashevillena]MDC0711843.1 alpha/beta fold hydrolase [Stigmatella ashevillena]
MKHPTFAAVAAVWCALVLGGPSHASEQGTATREDEFIGCPDAKVDAALAGSLCARFSAPLDYADPSRERIELFVRKFPAPGRSAGQVWLVAGGPGESGASFYPLLKTLRAAFPGYDLLVPDHRGTGFSSRLCQKEEAADSAGGAALQDAEWVTCFEALESDSKRTRAFSISHAAHDLRALMNRYSAGRATWLYGVSYGTQLVLRTMTVAPPRRLDGIVLDSLVPPETTEQWDLSHRSAIVDEVGRRVLAHCDADPSCRARLEGSAVAAMQGLIDDPKLSALVPGGRPKLFFGSLLDSPELRARIPLVLSGLKGGDLEPLRQVQHDLEALSAQFGGLPQSSISIPLVSVISASENNARPGLTKAQVEAEAAQFLFVSSLPGQLVGRTSLAYPRDEWFGRLPAALPPVLVLQGDMDPKTPHAGALAHLRLLPKAAGVNLFTVKGGPHFLLFTAPDCFSAAVSAFIQKRRAPRTACSI